VFGGNPYAPELAYYPEHNTLSPLRTDGYYDKVDLIYTALPRNAKSLTYRITDAKTGETYYRKTVDYVGKSVYNANYDTILPAGSFASTAIDPWYGVDSAGEMLKDDTTVIVSIDAELDHDGFTAAQNKNAHWEFPVTIDNTPPQILSSTSDGETLTLEVADSRYLAYVEVYDVEHMNVFSEPVFSQGYSSKTPGETATVRVNVSGLNKVYVCLADYGRNEKVVTLDAKTGKLIESSQFEYFESNGEITITGYTGGSNLSTAILAAAVLALVIWYVMQKTSRGYEMKLTGQNERFARFIGIRTDRLVLVCMLLSGALCGLVGMFRVYGAEHLFRDSISRDYYFEGLMVAMIARYQPLAVVFLSLFFAALKIGAQGMELIGIPSQIYLIIQTVIIFCMAARLCSKFIAEVSRSWASSACRRGAAARWVS